MKISPQTIAIVLGWYKEWQSDPSKTKTFGQYASYNLEGSYPDIFHEHDHDKVMSMTSNALEIRKEIDRVESIRGSKRLLKGLE